MLNRNPQSTNLMDSGILAEIKRLHFQAKHLLSSSLYGEYRSAFRGQGMEFEEVREYMPGDDIRAIDWNVTARSKKTYVKLFREERELTVLLVVDISSSTMTATKKQLRQQVIAKAGAVLSFIAQGNNDKVGLVIFSNGVSKYIPPGKARNTSWRILHELISISHFPQETNFQKCFRFIDRVTKHHAIVFIISDFLTSIDCKELTLLTRRHDVTAVRVTDPSENTLPKVGLVEIQDPESGANRLLNLNDPHILDFLSSKSVEFRQNQNELFERYGIGYFDLSTTGEFIKAFTKYFDKRTHRYSRSKRHVK